MEACNVAPTFEYVSNILIITLAFNSLHSKLCQLFLLWQSSLNLVSLAAVLCLIKNAPPHKLLLTFQPQSFPDFSQSQLQFHLLELPLTKLSLDDLLNHSP